MINVNLFWRRAISKQYAKLVGRQDLNQPHPPVPWDVASYTNKADVDIVAWNTAEVIATVAGKRGHATALANAQFIQQATEHHESLVESLRQTCDALETILLKCNRHLSLAEDAELTAVMNKASELLEAIEDAVNS